MDIISIILLLAALAILITALVYITFATSAITKADNYKTDVKLQQAHTFLLWTSILMWIALVGIIVISLVRFFEGESDDADFVVTIVGDILIVLCLITGILTAMAAAKINSTPNGKTGKGKDAYNDCFIAMFLTFGLVAVIVIKWALGF